MPRTVEQIDKALAQLEAWQQSAREVPALPRLNTTEILNSDPLLIRAHGGTQSSKLSTGDLRDWILQQWGLPPIAVTADKLLDAETDCNRLLLADAAAGPVRLTLPLLSTVKAGAVLAIQKIDSNTGTVTITAQAGEHRQDTVLAKHQDWCFCIAGDTKWHILSLNLASHISTLPTGYRAGLQLSNSVTNTHFGITISPGAARAIQDDADMRLTTSLTKRLDAQWAFGNDQGGLFSGTPQASTWYHTHLIYRDHDGSVDLGFDTSPTAENRPAGWSRYRRLGAVLTDHTTIIRPFTHVNDIVWWDEPIADIDDTSGLTTRTDFVVSVPPGEAGMAIVGLSVEDTSDPFPAIHLSSAQQKPVPPHQYQPPYGHIGNIGGLAETSNRVAGILVPTDDQGRISAQADSRLGRMRLTVLAYSVPF